MAIVNGTMIPLARMERGCPQSGRGRGQEIVSCGGYIHGTPNGVLMHRLNSYHAYDGHGWIYRYKQFLKQRKGVRDEAMITLMTNNSAYLLS